MSIFSLASGLVKLFGSVANIFREKNLMDAGAAKQIVKSKIKTEKELQDARNHKRSVRNAIRADNDLKLRSKWTRKD